MPAPFVTRNEEEIVTIHYGRMSATFEEGYEHPLGVTYDVWFTEPHGERHMYTTWTRTDYEEWADKSLNEALNYRFMTEGYNYADLVRTGMDMDETRFEDANYIFAERKERG